jgi:outer membrane protein OmpA-like peptidoglycan-associated protein
VDAVKALLTGQGVPGNAIQGIAKGKVNPVAPNDTPEGRAKNRRVEIKVFQAPASAQP